ncbi:MAG: diguanylate cyclase [Pseudomonadales bacterium]
MLQLTLWSLPSLAAILISLYALRLPERVSRVPGSAALGAVAWCVLIWSAGQLVGTLSTSLAVKMLASKLQYPGIALLPVAWMAFAITYIRRRQRLRPLTLTLLCIVPAITVSLAWTNDWHGLLWADVRLNALPGFVALAIDYGPWFTVSAGYAYLLVAAATLILAFELSASPQHRRALVAVIVAPAIVVALNLLHLTRWNPFPYIDPTPLGFALGMIVIARNVLRSGLLQLSPVLHRQVVEQLADGVIIVDDDGHLVDLNPAARKLLSTDPTWATGSRSGRALREGPLRGLLTGEADSVELAIGERTYHVRGTRLEPEAPGAGQTVLVLRDITERLEAEGALRQVKQEMERLAHTDALTGLHNRRYFLRRMNEESERVKRHGHALSVLLLDLDHFKEINDTHGHDAGDRMLEQIARVIEASKRDSDVAARLGGEEFALLLPETSVDGALRLAERLRVLIADTTISTVAAASVGLTTSIGVATVSPSTPSAAALLQRADRALYEAKRAGRNAVHCARD